MIINYVNIKIKENIHYIFEGKTHSNISTRLYFKFEEDNRSLIMKDDLQDPGFDEFGDEIL